jgi:hypothetical protein
MHLVHVEDVGIPIPHNPEGDGISRRVNFYFKHRILACHDWLLVNGAGPFPLAMIESYMPQPKLQ